MTKVTERRNIYCAHFIGNFWQLELRTGVSLFLKICKHGIFFRILLNPKRLRCRLHSAAPQQLKTRDLILGSPVGRGSGGSLGTLLLLVVYSRVPALPGGSDRRQICEPSYKFKTGIQNLNYMKFSGKGGSIFWLIDWIQQRQPGSFISFHYSKFKFWRKDREYKF